MDAEQGLACKGPIEPVAQESMERADTERPDRADDGRASAPTACSSSDTARAALRAVMSSRSGHAPSLRRANVSARPRRGVEPLEIVDRDEQRPVSASTCERAAGRKPDCARIDGAVVRLLEQQRDLEGVPPRRRQHGQDVVERAFEQIAQRDMAQASLRFGGPREQDARAPLPGMLDRRLEERRLADPRFAFEDECGRPGLRVVDEGEDDATFFLSADDLQRHLAAIVTGAAEKASCDRGKAPFGALEVAGAGFEPATSGL